MAKASCNQVVDNVIGNGSNYVNAYWEISYIRTYLAEGAVSPTPTGSGLSPTSGAPSADSTNSASLSPSSKPSSATTSRLSILSLTFSLLLILVSGL